MENEFNNQKWGWRYELEDRLWLVNAAKPMTYSRAAADPPEEFDPRPWMKVEQQGSIGSCAGCARTNVLELCNYIQTGGDVIHLSKMFSYLTAQKLDGLLGADQGSTITGNRKASEMIGNCLETTAPYPNPVRYTTQIPAVAYEEALKHRSRNHVYCRNYQDCWDFLSAGFGGVQIGVAWNSSWTPRNGIIESVSTGGGGGGHSVCMVGWTKRVDAEGRHYLLVPNTWGPTWGTNGWAEVAPRVFDQIGGSRYTEMIGLSDLEHFGEARKIRDWGAIL